MKYTLESLQKYLCSIYDDCDRCPLGIHSERYEDQCAINLVTMIANQTLESIKLLKEDKEIN